MHVVVEGTRRCVLSRACAIDSCSCWHAAVVSAALTILCGESAMAGSVVCDGVSCVVAQVSSRRVYLASVELCVQCACHGCEAVGLQCIWRRDCGVTAM
jgi:hypothetical protein